MKKSGSTHEEVVTFDNQPDVNQGEIITVDDQPETIQGEVAVPDRYPQRFLNFPQQIFRKIIKQIDPPARGESNQKVYEKEKRRNRENQFIWYILIVIEISLGLRLILKTSGADPTFGFARIIYPITDAFVFPFSGLSGNFANDGWSTIFAGIVYLCIAWGVVYLLHLIYPITPKNLETR